jgi:hypothetical protein
LVIFNGLLHFIHTSSAHALHLLSFRQKYTRNSLMLPLNSGAQLFKNGCT